MLKILYDMLGVLLFLAGVFVVYAANQDKTNRHRQRPLPAVAALFCLLAIIFNARHGGEMTASLDGFVAAIGLGDGTESVFLRVAVLNMWIMFIFAIIKAVYNLVARLSDLTFEQVEMTPYAYDKEYQHWFLKQGCLGMRELAKWSFACVTILASLLFLFSGILSQSPAFQNSFFPAYASIVVGELFYYLDGTTKEEYLDDVSFEADGAIHVFQYAKVWEVLSHYFGDRLLQVSSHGASQGSPGTHDDFCQSLIESDDHWTRLAGGYFDKLVKRGLIGSADKDGGYGSLNHDMALNTIRLMQGKSVMFASPFCRDFIPYIFLPLCSRLMRNEKVLVLYGPAVSEDSLVSYLDEGFRFVTGVSGMWTIEELPSKEDGSKGTSDVVLLPYSSLSNVRRIIDNADTLSRVSMVLVIDPSSLIATCQIGLNFLAEYVSYGCPVNYCIFDQNADGLVDALSHALRTNLTEVGATEASEGSAIGMFWEVDGEQLQHRLLPGVAHYLGVGTEIALVALKAQIPKVSWASRSAVPLADQRWIDGQYYSELLRFAELPEEQLQLDEHIDFCTDTWSLGKREDAFIVAEDEYQNMFETFRQFATRGTQQSFVNVLAPNYLLRSYMAENRQIFENDPKAIPAISPDFSKSQRNAIFSIVMAMVQSGRMVSEEELRKRFKYVGLSVTNMKEALEGLLIEHLELVDDDPDKYPERHVIMEETEEYDPTTREIEVRRHYGISNLAKYDECFASLRNVPVVTEMPDGSELLLGSRLYGHVYQSYLPGQFVVVEGKYYEVVSISKDTGVMLRRAADHFSSRRYYRQLRTYSVDSWTQEEVIGDTRTVSGVEVRKIRYSGSVTTAGYIDLQDYGDLAGGSVVNLSNIPVRKYRNKDALRLEFPGADAHITATIAVLMSEIVVTLFPKDHPYLAVVTPSAGKLADPEQQVLYGYQGQGADTDANVIYIIEDSLIDIGLITSVDRNIHRILEICWDYLDWHLGMLLGGSQGEQTPDPGEPPAFIPPVEEKGFIQRLIEKLDRLLRKKDKDGGKPAGGQGGKPAGPGKPEEPEKPQKPDEPEEPKKPGEPESVKPEPEKPGQEPKAGSTDGDGKDEPETDGPHPADEDEKDPEIEIELKSEDVGQSPDGEASLEAEPAEEKPESDALPEGDEA